MGLNLKKEARKILQKISPKNEALIEVLIYKSRLLHNLEVYRKHQGGLGVAPVLKSNAYGHGIVQIASVLDKEGLPFIVVDSFFEARLLRSEGIKSPLLVIGYTPISNFSSGRISNTAYTITSIDELEKIALVLRDKTRFHLKFDTGMHRQGIMPYELQRVLKIIAKNPSIIIEGICSHFADTDDPFSIMTVQQITSFNRIVSIFRQKIPSIKYYHLSATGGAQFAGKADANIMRIGRGLYGFDYSTPLADKLLPILEMKTRITSIRPVGKGESIGYGRTFIAEHNMKVATIPVGYFEGMDRRLSNRGHVKIKGKLCPILGRISMNITSVDVSGITTKLEDSVTVISADRDDKNSILNIARTCDTIPHEITVHIAQHLRRTLI